MSHTPGPWTVSVRSAYTGNYIVKEAGPREDEDNARLIAAAPALLEAITMVRDADEDCAKDGLQRIPAAARAMIDAALKLAGVE